MTRTTRDAQVTKPTHDDLVKLLERCDGYLHHEVYYSEAALDQLKRDVRYTIDTLRGAK